MSDFEVYYLAMVIGAMTIFAVTLAAVTSWSNKRP